MAVTAGGTPYVESSDLVANYPGASLSLANRVDQVMQAPTQNSQTGTTYTAALLDAGKTVTLSNASAVTLTIPAQATVAWVANTQLNFLNLGAGTVTITPAVDVTINGTPLTLATSQGGSLVRTASNTWTFTPTGGAGGKVLQVKSVALPSTFTTTSLSFVDITSFTIDITLASTSSKVACFFTGAYYASGTNFRTLYRIMRGATLISESLVTTTPGTYTNSVSAIGVDAPASISALTYKMMMRGADVGTVECVAGQRSNLIIMEIGA